jgi:hypothetical protein
MLTLNICTVSFPFRRPWTVSVLCRSHLFMLGVCSDAFISSDYDVPNNCRIHEWRAGKDLEGNSFALNSWYYLNIWQEALRKSMISSNRKQKCQPLDHHILYECTLIMQCCCSSRSITLPPDVLIYGPRPLDISTYCLKETTHLLWFLVNTTVQFLPTEQVAGWAPQPGWTI